jgi:2-succinyl-6-hydroxy-2,4-cyclohexadiene-1-carboxylate synthase
MASRDASGLHLRRWGRRTGRPILLLHGFTGSGDAWGTELVRGLARDHRVLVVDLPGHSRSAPPSEGMAGLIQRLTVLLDGEDAERAWWVGYSMGGRIALGAGVLVPERVAGLVLEGASPGLETGRAREQRRQRDEMLARAIESRGMEWFVDRWLSLPLFGSQRALPAHVQAANRRRRLQNHPAGLAAALRTLGTGSQPSFWPHVSSVRAPTLLLTGELDRKYEALARQMARSLPDVRHRSVAEVGHTVHLEAPARWLEEVLDFLEGC